MNVDDRLLQQLSVLGLNSAPPPKTFGLCLGEAPQIEQDAFIGRTTELRELQELLNFENQSQRIVSIVGMGGLGKTQLSLAYARQCSDQYTSIFWVNAKDELSLRQSLCSIADIVQSGTSVSVNDSKGEQTQVEVVRRWLSEGWNSRWLFIFDNYDDPNLPNIPSASGYNIRSYFPYRMQGHILITTRTPKLTFSSRLMLSKFDSVETSLMVLAQRAGRDLTTGWCQGEIYPGLLADDKQTRMLEDLLSDWTVSLLLWQQLASTSVRPMCPARNIFRLMSRHGLTCMVLTLTNYLNTKIVHCRQPGLSHLIRSGE